MVVISKIDYAIVAKIGSFLGAVGLLNLGFATKQFGLAVEGEELSFVEKVARQSFETLATEEERRQLPKYHGETYMSLLFQLEELRRPLEFDMLVGHSIIYRYPSPLFGKNDIGYRGGNEGIDDCVGTAISRHVMRAGRHGATFTISKCCEQPFHVGVVRPIISSCMKDAPVKFCPLTDDSSENEMMLAGKTDAWRSTIHACAYDCQTGLCCWSDFEDLSQESWDGGEELPMVPISYCDNVQVHLLLDLDKGTLTVSLEASEVAYHDPVRRRLGVMKDGLAGEYSWFASIQEPTSDDIHITRWSLCNVLEGST